MLCYVMIAASNSLHSCCSSVPFTSLVAPVLLSSSGSKKTIASAW
jgi:hypothetical protein